MGQTLSFSDIPLMTLTRKSFVDDTASKVISSASVGPHSNSGPKMSTNTDPTLNKGVEADALSTFTVETGVNKKDDGNAPLPFPYQQMNLETRSNRRRRGWCCRKRRQADGDDTELLRSFSKQGMAHSSSSSDDDEIEVACFDEKPEPLKTDHALSPMTANFGGGQPDAVAVAKKPKPKIRRTRVPNRPDVSMSLWSVIKNAIGKDLTKLPLPVNFNEPLSMLQRLTEDFEYSSLLDKAALCTDPYEQLAYITAFTISSFASSAARTGKPFNPLLGETYECDRTADLGWRCLSEQVSHHPPQVAQHCQGRRWICWQQFSMTSKFRGNSIEITPQGLAHLLFPKTGMHYTWRKVPTIVHNIMLGKLWIDQEGEMNIFNHSTGETCFVEFKTSSFFRGDSKRVVGTVSDKNKQPKIFLGGNWDAKIESFPILKVDSKGNYTLGPGRVLWAKTNPPVDSEKFYNFTTLACQLNEMEEGVAPTDSRRRPDQRLMENGQFDEANVEKLKLEEKQRTARKARLLQLSANKGHPKSTTVSATPTKQTGVSESDDDAGDREAGYTPAWFSLAKDQVTGKMTHIYSGDYWECKRKQDWSRCPDVFGR